MVTDRKKISISAIKKKYARTIVTHINIGEFLASKDPLVIKTLLGSCVSACLYDCERKIGGMNHILVPGKARMGEFNSASRFGINAMELLINAMLSLGADRKTMIAKVFGGAHVTPGMSENMSMGPKNARFILDFLGQENIDVKAEDLGGYNARIIYFHTHTGSVYMRRRPSLKSSQLTRLELQHQENVKCQLEKPTDVVLFHPDE